MGRPRTGAHPSTRGWTRATVIGALTLGVTACESTAVSVVPVGSVEVVPDQITVAKGQRDTVTAILRESAGRELSGRNVTWSVEEGHVAAVTKEGIVEGRAAGSTWLQAESEGVVGRAEIEVLPPPTIRLTPDSLAFEGRSGLRRTYSAEVVVDNAGGGSLDQLTVTVGEGGTEPVPWLEAHLFEEVAPTRLLIQVTARYLAPGSYSADVVVASPADESGSRSVRVRMEATHWFPWGTSASPEDGSSDTDAGH